LLEISTDSCGTMGASWSSDDASTSLRHDAACSAHVGCTTAVPEGTSPGRAAHAQSGDGQQAKKGILKRRPAALTRVPPPSLLQRLLLWLVGGGDGAERAQVRPRISFAPAVNVVEFERVLGGSDGIPQDGTVLPLGLGRRRRTSSAPLARVSIRRLPVEDRCYIPVKARIQLLRKAMGDARFAASWHQCKREIACTLRSRKQAKNDPQTKRFEFMPTSMSEAVRRAAALAREVRGTSRVKSDDGMKNLKRRAEEKLLDPRAGKRLAKPGVVKVVKLATPDVEKKVLAPRPARGGA